MQVRMHSLTADDEEKRAVLLSHPDQYIGALLGHEGPGSLLSYYKAKVTSTLFVYGAVCMSWIVYCRQRCTVVLEAELVLRARRAQMQCCISDNL
jgi:hypothetical protein